MGAGGKKPAMHEIAETRAAGRDEAFELIIERIKSSGGKVVEDENVPLYTELGSNQYEIGTQRTVVFNLNKLDFKLIRKVETSFVSGEGSHKHMEDSPTPRVKIILKKKLESASDWQLVDMDDMF